MSSTIVYDNARSPRITLTRTDGGGFVAVIEVEGLDPQRDTTAEERMLGVLSLKPPTVQVRAMRRASDAHRMLIEASFRALSASLVSTTGADPRPGDIMMMYMRLVFALRAALRKIGETV